MLYQNQLAINMPENLLTEVSNRQPVAYRDVIVAAVGDVGDGACAFRWNHQLVLNQGVLLHDAKYVTSGHVTAHLSANQKSSMQMQTHAQINNLCITYYNYFT